MFSSLARTLQKSTAAHQLSVRKFSSLNHNVQLNTAISTPPSPFQSLTRKKGQYASRLPDYAVSHSEAAIEFESISIPTNVDIGTINKNTHPLEAGAQKYREKADIFARLKPNQVVFTNLPLDITNTNFSNAQTLQTFLLQKIHLDLEVQAIDFFKAITTAEQKERIAYIRITLGSKRQAHMVAKGLRQHWVGDSLLKIKLQEDATREVYDNRTILIRNLPTNLNQRQILETFATEEVGSIVGIELPMENIAISEYMAEKALSGPTSQIAIDKKSQFKAAQMAVEQQLGQSVIDESLGQRSSQDSQQRDFLVTEKMNSLIRMVTRLQAEGKQVLSSKLDLLKIRDGTSNSASISSIQNASETDLKDRILSSQLQIDRIVKYLKKNNDSTNSTTFFSLEEIVKLSQGELTHAYDMLIKALDARESLIERRIGDSLKHFGITERILIEKKDFDKELEDIAATFQDPDRFKAEEYISLQEQITYVLRQKNMTPEEKFARVMKKALNPFIDLNMNEDQYRFSEHPELELHKKIEVPDPRLPRSVLRMMREGSDFKYESRLIVDELVQDLRNRFDIPFDELYHKEKSLVQAVVQAQQDLDAKQATLKNPSHDSLISEAEEIKITRSSVLTKENVGPKERSMIAERDAFGSQYEFKSAQEQGLKDMETSGLISKSEAERVKQLAREAEHRNLGYCFLTFSHSDEARVMLMMNTNPFFQYQQIQIDLKSNVDHGELDFGFYMSRGKNDAKLVEEISRLRKAKEDLKNFESKIDQELPSRRKLQEFRNLAKDLIEDQSGTTRQGRANVRTLEEDERLRLKMKDFQLKYPHVDVTQLFDTQKAEDVRLAQHKKAFASYKAYEFLKAGVQTAPAKKYQKSEAKRRLEENDPYNFPQLDQTINAVLSKQIMTPQLLDHGEYINVPGRRFKGYSETEFLEAFFGKDMMRQAITDKKQDALFLTQESLKERYPVSGFLKSPAVDERYRKLKSLGLEPNVEQLRGLNLYPQDAELADVMREREGEFKRGEHLKDRSHPTDESRTLLKDLESMLSKYDTSREQKGMPDTYDMHEIGLIRQKLYDEYELGEKDWFDQVKKGKFKRDHDSEDEAVAEVEEEKSSAQFEHEYDNDSSTKDSKRINREFLYSMQADKQNEKFVSPEMKRMAKANKMTPTELVQKIKEQGPISEAGSIYGGKWFKEHSIGLEQKENGPAPKYGQSLQNFANGEELDIYAKYQQQLKTQQESQEPVFNIDKDSHQPEMPRFQGFFDAQSKDMHPFDQMKHNIDEKNQELDLQDEDKEAERELYARELMGRLMSEKLSPRQFELITGQYSDKDAKLKHVKDQQNDIFLSHRDIIRINEEHVEQFRRRQITSGQWSESESHSNLAKHLQDLVDNKKGPNELKIFRREFQDVLEAISLMDNPERIFDKEYHFDEGLGQSLNDHVIEIKTKFPEMKVQTRRDRDGFAIVKVTFEPEYKYNINDIEAWDKDEKRTHLNQTVETILAQLIPEGNPTLALKQLKSSEGMTQLVKGMHMQQDPENNFEFDAWTKLKIQELAEQSSQGKISDKEVITGLQDISKNAQFDLSQTIVKSIFSQNLHPDSALENLLQDRERFRFEVSDQLVKRMKKHMFGTKRQDSDFVQGRISEQNVYNRQQRSHDNAIQSLESKTDKIDQSKDFDRVAYENMKTEISQRKEAKQRMLNQGLPEFKAYLRF